MPKFEVFRLYLGPIGKKILPMGKSLRRPPTEDDNTALDLAELATLLLATVSVIPTQEYCITCGEGGAQMGQKPLGKLRLTFA